MATRKEIRGGAAILTLSSGITAGSTSIQCTGTVTGWPTGASYPFVIRIGTEKILCSALAGSAPATLTVSTRGFDGTSAASHDANAEVIHAVDAALIEDLQLHMYDVSRNDHTQYTKKDGSVAFTGVTAITSATDPVSVDTSASAGSGNTLARANHRHALANNVVVNAKIAAGELKLAKWESGIRPVFRDASEPGTPDDGDFWVDDDTNVYVYDGTVWRLLDGPDYPIPSYSGANVDNVNNTAESFICDSGTIITAPFDLTMHVTICGRAGFAVISNVQVIRLTDGAGTDITGLPDGHLYVNPPVSGNWQAFTLIGSKNFNEGQACRFKVGHRVADGGSGVGNGYVDLQTKAEFTQRWS